MIVLDVVDGDGGWEYEGYGVVGFVSNGRMWKIIYLMWFCVKFIF